MLFVQKMFLFYLVYFETPIYICVVLFNTIMNRFEEIRKDYDAICNATCQYFEVSKEDLLKRNLKLCVDARYVVISIMCDEYDDYDISVVSGLTKPCVNNIRNEMRYDAKKKRLSRYILLIKNELNKS
jgi:hypothetical protein